MYLMRRPESIFFTATFNEAKQKFGLEHPGWKAFHKGIDNITTVNRNVIAKN